MVFYQDILNDGIGSRGIRFVTSFLLDSFDLVLEVISYYLADIPRFDGCQDRATILWVAPVINNFPLRLVGPPTVLFEIWLSSEHL